MGLHAAPGLPHVARPRRSPQLSSLSPSLLHRSSSLANAQAVSDAGLSLAVMCKGVWCKASCTSADALNQLADPSDLLSDAQHGMPASPALSTGGVQTLYRCRHLLLQLLSSASIADFSRPWIPCFLSLLSTWCVDCWQVLGRPAADCVQPARATLAESCYGAGRRTAPSARRGRCTWARPLAPPASHQSS